MPNQATGVEDANEGTTTALLDEVFIYPGCDDGLRKRMKNVGINIGDNARFFSIGGRSTDVAADCYIFSLTLNNTLGSFGPMYDTVVGLSDVAHFGAAIQAAAPDRLGQGSFGLVRYDKVVVDIRECSRPPASPWLKASEFAWQRELRLIWRALGPIVDPLDVQSDELIAMFARGLQTRLQP